MNNIYGGIILDIAKPFFDSLVRTVVPVAVGAVVAFFVTSGFALDPEFEVALTALLTGLLTVAYYGVARLLELYVAPKFGWLLGLAKAPVYPEARETPGKHAA